MGVQLLCLLQHCDGISHNLGDNQTTETTPRDSLVAL